jgi:hypothetical protein
MFFAVMAINGKKKGFHKAKDNISKTFIPLEL